MALPRVKSDLVGNFLCLARFSAPGSNGVPSWAIRQTKLSLRIMSRSRMCTMVRLRSCVSIPLVSKRMGSPSLVLSSSVGGDNSCVSGGDGGCGELLDTGGGLGESREVEGFGSGVNRDSSVESEARNVSNVRCWSGPQWNSVSFFNKEARGLDICENLSINLR